MAENSTIQFLSMVGRLYCTSTLSSDSFSLPVMIPFSETALMHLWSPESCQLHVDNLLYVKYEDYN